ncbi:MAG: hypothetical protein WCV93_00345 [Candidatus Shapirobacteria bacterium]|jgi:hypothetical protein
MTKTKITILLISILLVVGATSFIYLNINKIPAEDFKAPGKSWQSPKKVEDYFIDKLRFTQSDLERQKQSETVDFRPGKGSTLDAIISNLNYYGFIRSEKALMYALENTKDITQGNPGLLSVGKNGSIDIVASYRISENMTAWEIADTLLNKSHYFGPNDEYNYMFMP